MKLPCEIIRDLLPLYHDGVCSEVSKTLVQEHLKTCEDCASVLKKIDTDIDFPKLEADAAKPLKAIQRKWNKKAWYKGLCIGLAAFLVFFTCWWGLTQWCIVPLHGSDYTNIERYQLSNGYLYIGFSWDHGGCDLEPAVIYTEAGEAYYYRLRPILSGREDEDHPQFGPEECFFIPPEGRNGILENGEPVKLTSIYAGTPENPVLLWEEGMELPAAPDKVEDQFQMLENAYAAPNAPERPDTFHIVTFPPESSDDHAPSGNSLEETVVPATGPTMEPQ